MNTFKKIAMSIAMLAAFQVGCGDESDDNEPKDSDPMNTDNGTDSDTGVVSSDFLMVDENGAITPNVWNISGTWYTYDDNTAGDTGIPGTSTITGSVSATGKGYCAVGTSAMTIDNDGDGSVDYSVNWGAGIGFNICAFSETDVHTIATCPNNLSTLTGFTLTIAATEFPASELRVTFAEGVEPNVRNESTYIDAASVAELGVPYTYLFADAEVGYLSDPSTAPINIPEVKALQVQVSSVTTADTPFNFCVEDITPVTAM